MAQQATPQTEVAQPPSAKKTIILVAAILLVEAVAIVGVMMFLSGPAKVDASSIPHSMDVAGDERIVETLILNAKLPNNRAGVTFVYDTEIYVQTKQRHTARIANELEQFQNELRAEISAIWRTSEPQHFQEPTLETLTRKIHALLSGRFGMDEAAGEPIVQKCVIVMGTGFRIDS